jgi:MarR family transcriptional regulator for hemolysin
MALKAKGVQHHSISRHSSASALGNAPRATGTGHVAFRAALAADTPVSTSMEANSSTLDFLLHDVARLLRKRFEQNARGSGLTRSQWQVLTYLARNEGISQSGLAELLDVEQITLCRIVDRLQAFGLIERHPHPSDRRVWILHLTPTAHPKLMQVREFGDTRGEALAVVSDIDRLHLSKTLQTLKINLTDACDSSVAGHKRVSHG